MRGARQIEKESLTSVREKIQEIPHRRKLTMNGKGGVLLRLKIRGANVNSIHQPG